MRPHPDDFAECWHCGELHDNHGNYCTPDCERDEALDRAVELYLVLIEREGVDSERAVEIVAEWPKDRDVFRMARAAARARLDKRVCGEDCGDWFVVGYRPGGAAVVLATRETEDLAEARAAEFRSMLEGYERIVVELATVRV